MLGFEKNEPNENGEEGNGPPTYGREKLQTVGIDTLNEPTNETGRARRMETDRQRGSHATSHGVPPQPQRTHKNQRPTQKIRRIAKARWTLEINPPS
jgi:hypothetical protein